MRRFRTLRLQIPKKSVPLQRVFHSIRFKVNKVGVQRYSFFFAHTLILRQLSANLTSILRQSYVNSTPTLHQPYVNFTLPLRYFSVNFPLTFRQPCPPADPFTRRPISLFTSFSLLLHFLFTPSSLPLHSFCASLFFPPHFLLTPPFSPFSPPVPLAFPASKTGNPSPFSAPVSRAWILSRNITVILLIYSRLFISHVTYEKKNVTSLRRM